MLFLADTHRQSHRVILHFQIQSIKTEEQIGLLKINHNYFIHKKHGAINLSSGWSIQTFFRSTTTTSIVSGQPYSSFHKPWLGAIARKAASNCKIQKDQPKPGHYGF